jgi:hypothetical protein
MRGSREWSGNEAAEGNAHARTAGALAVVSRLTGVAIGPPASAIHRFAAENDRKFGRPGRIVAPFALA